MFFLAGNAILILLIFSSVVLPKNQTIRIISKKPLASVPISLTPTPTINPTLTPTPTPTDEPTPTLKPTQIPPTPGSTKSETSNSSATSNVSASTTDIGLTLMKQINDFRVGKGLSPLSTDGNTCGFAVVRAAEIVGNFNHDGFESRVSGHTLPYPSYHEVAENIAMNSDSNAVIQAWIDSPGHNVNLSKDVPFACVGKNGNYYTFEAWKP